MDKATKLFTERVRERLAHLGISKSDLARRLGVPPSGVSQYVAGKIKPGLDQISKYAKALECDPSYLTGAEATVVEVKVERSRFEVAGEMLEHYLPDGDRKEATLLLLNCDQDIFDSLVGGLKPFMKAARKAKNVTAG